MDFDYYNFELENDSDLEMNDYNIADLKTLGFNDFPEPLDIIGQFILSTLIGVICNHIKLIKNNKFVDINSLVDKYIDYCSNVLSDTYINELKQKLKKNNEKFKELLNNIGVIIKEILNKFNKNKFIDTIPTDKCGIELFEKNLFLELLPHIKADELIILLN